MFSREILLEINTDTNIDLLVRQIVSLATGISGNKVIPAEDGHAAPNSPYATVKQVRYHNLGTNGRRDAYNTNTGLFNVEYTQRVRASWDINFYGEEHAKISKLLTIKMGTEELKEACHARELAFQLVSDIKDLTFLLGKEYVPRSQLEIMFTFSYKYHKEISPMESAEITFNEAENVEVTIS